MINIFYHDKLALANQISNPVKIIGEDNLIKMTGGSSSVIDFIPVSTIDGKLKIDECVYRSTGHNTSKENKVKVVNRHMSKSAIFRALAEGAEDRVFGYEKTIELLAKALLNDEDNSK